MLLKGNLDESPHIILTDHSKFGTFVNDNKIEDFKVLKPNDKITFGVNDSSFV